MKISGTGHRPNKLGGYDLLTLNKLIDLATNWLNLNQPELVISGMALGWDQALAIAAIRLRIPVTAAIPFAGQERMWPQKSQDLYNRILRHCTGSVIVSQGGFSAAAMQQRNVWMVDYSDQVLALWDGSTGGTGNCITYAKSKNRVIINLWPEWIS